MYNWLESVYSDGTAEFVSSPSPSLGETVKVRVRMYEDAPVSQVYVRSLHNGLQELTKARKVRRAHGLQYYQAPILVDEPRLEYSFFIIAQGTVYCLTQLGVTTYLQGETYNFVLLADYVQPSWVRDAVFYQIFPERFRNGDPSNDVQTGEYTFAGQKPIKMDWDAEPLDYNKGRCMDFYGGDLRGIREKLGYLKDLGVTALYLNPIFEAPSVHKYDCIDYFKVDPHLGGDEVLAELTRAAHELDMKVILDISINHTGSAHKWFNRYCDFYPESVGAYHNQDSEERGYYFFGPDNTYHGWYGNESLPTLNYTSQALRDRVYRAEDSVIRKWLKPPYSIDGWRFDVADTFARHNEIQLAHEIWPELRRAIREENPQAYILAEDWGDCAQYQQGNEWDAPMSYFTCGRVIRRFLGQPDHFFESIPAFRRCKAPMTGDEVESTVTQYLAKLPWVIRENQFNLFDSHDISRLHNDPKISFKEWRGAAIYQFILPGAASIYYGDELGIGGTLGTNEGCRWPMPWDKAPAPGRETPEQYTIYKTLTELKHANRTLSRGGMKFIYAQGPVFAIARFTLHQVFCAVFSNSDRARAVNLPLHSVGAQEPLGGRDVFGSILTYKPTQNGVQLNVEPHSAYLFKCLMK